MTTERPRVTRQDVARAAGTSVAVVSYVVNNGPRPVSRLTRERVLKAITETGYRPNGIAKALAAGRTGTYALIVPDVSNPFFAALAHALEDRTYAMGKVLLLGNSGQSSDRERAIIEKFIQQQVDGVLYVGVNPPGGLDLLTASGIPVVMLDRMADGTDAACVTINNTEAARVATGHLVSHGYRDIGLVTGPANLSTSADRRRGWQIAIVDAGLRADESAVFVEEFSRAGGLRAGQRLLAERPDLDAVFVASDQMALGVGKTAADMGRRIPDDLAIVTFDGTSDTQYFTPPLTTIAQPLDEIASNAVTLLSQARPERVVCEFELVIGRSCGC
ncbi:LacI family transcriptional regulator [Kibdelosporangium philippinense]|uniref:LacI family transcriptional regulator n=1 Tax=Kibdelosporangium philippinense TaxID=211113 RepID=A0ABS8Z6W7_9PSEU|nr:LacI family DNA-binding transcriptional regulator [Kibdelosporangium philippinense]MCE7003619.1 LacI family transcriptional regulator [Kibdelosporangium philippinense]